MGQGPDVVLGLCDKAAVIEGTLLYFDNLFSSMPLMDALSERGKLHDTSHITHHTLCICMHATGPLYFIYDSI